MLDSIKDSISRLRIRWRYRASFVLFVAGIIYSVLGSGLLIPSFLAPPVSLLILIPAIFLLCMGLGMCKYRTEATRIALLWWEVPAVVILVALVVFLAYCGSTLKDEVAIVVSIIVALVIFAGPGIFVISHGRSLFGPTAMKHSQLKELYQNAIVNHIADPQIPALKVVAENNDQLLPCFIKFCGILFNLALACVVGLLSLDTYDRLVSEPNTSYTSYTSGSDNDYSCASSYSQSDYSYTPSYSQSAYHSYSPYTLYDTGYRYDSSGGSYSVRDTVKSNVASGDNAKSGWERTKEWCGEHKGELIAAGVAAAATAAAVMLSGDSSSADTGYSYKDSHSKIGKGLPFSQSQKAEILRQNMERNGGVLRSDLSGEILVAPQQCRKGVVPNPFEAQIDHIFPRSRGGANSAENAQVLGRRENIQKSNHVEGKGGFWSSLFK